MTMRISKQTRETKETKVEVALNLDAALCPNGAKYEISTGIKFFDHMLEQFAHHSGFDLTVKASSLDSDPHHLVEDVALTLGTAFKTALGDKRGIARYSSVILPMDEALVLCALDISGRACCKVEISMPECKVSDFETTLFAHFFQSFAQNSQITLHIKKMNEKEADAHHVMEAAFKATARALREAVKINGDTIPSTKGVL